MFGAEKSAIRVRKTSQSPTPKRKEKIKKTPEKDLE